MFDSVYCNAYRPKLCRLVFQVELETGRILNKKCGNCAGGPCKSKQKRTSSFRALKAGIRRSFNIHDCSGTTPQAGSHQGTVTTFRLGEAAQVIANVFTVRASKFPHNSNRGLRWNGIWVELKMPVTCGGPNSSQLPSLATGRAAVTNGHSHRVFCL